MAKAHFYPKVDNLSEYIVRAEKSPDEIRWLYIDAVLALMDGNRSATARRLGMHRKTLQRIISTHSQAQLNTTRE
jgi:ActR/RegA family two-component response regulator